MSPFEKAALPSTPSPLQLSATSHPQHRWPCWQGAGLALSALHGERGARCRASPPTATVQGLEQHPAVGSMWASSAAFDLGSWSIWGWKDIF